MSAPPGEIITLQLGHYANYVGAHYWNIQDSQLQYGSSATPTTDSTLSPDVLFRVGETLDGQPTYTPRLLLYDLRGGLGSLSQQGPLYSSHPDTSASTVWESSRTEIRRQTPLRPTPYLQQLDRDGVASAELWTRPTTWSDYLHPFLHPRSINVIKAYNFADPDASFDAYWQGLELWDTDRTLQEDFEDKLRLFVEETDACQGFQIFTHVHDGYAGLAQRMLAHMKDEYGRKAIATFGVIPADPTPPISADLPPSAIQKAKRREELATLTYALAGAHLTELSSTYNPVSTTPAWGQRREARSHLYFHFDHLDDYQSSSLLAAAIDQATLCARMKDSSIALGHLIGAISHRSGLSELSYTPLSQRRALSDVLYDWHGDSPHPETLPLSLTLDAPTVCSPHADFAYVCLRGANHIKLVPTKEELERRKSVRPFDMLTDASDLIQRFIAESGWARVFAVTAEPSILPWRSPPLPQHVMDYVDGASGSLAGWGMWSCGPNLGAVARSFHRAFSSVDFRPYVNSTTMEAEAFTHAKELLRAKVEDFVDKE